MQLVTGSVAASLNTNNNDWDGLMINVFTRETEGMMCSH